MSEFKKGQLVVAWNNDFSKRRRIRIFVKTDVSTLDGKTVYVCREAGEDEKYAIPWYHCAPIEMFEPNVFIAKDNKDA